MCEVGTWARHMGLQARSLIISWPVTKKERVRKHTSHWLPSTNPGAHVLLVYSTQFRPSISHSALATYSFFQTNITRPRDVQVPCIPHNNRACFAQSHRCQSGNSFITFAKYVHSPESTSSLLHQMFTKTPNPQCRLLFLFLSNSSTVAWPIVRRSGNF
jgi:hypothetical protein